MAKRNYSTLPPSLYPKSATETFPLTPSTVKKKKNQKALLSFLAYKEILFILNPSFESLFKLNLEINYKLLCLRLFCHTAVKKHMPVWKILVLSTRFMKCYFAPRLISMSLFSISRAYDNDSDQCYFNTAQRPGCQGHHFIRQQNY